MRTQVKELGHKHNRQEDPQQSQKHVEDQLKFESTGQLYKNLLYICRCNGLTIPRDCMKHVEQIVG